MSFRPKYALVMSLFKLLKIAFWFAALVSPLSMRYRTRRSAELSCWTKDTTLVIIDMQKEFPASSRVLAAVMREVEIALQNDWAIVVLEYFSKGPTYSQITDMAKKSRRYTVETKYQDGGGREVLIACRRIKSPTGIGSKFRICGVNTHACVNKTVLGMSYFFPSSLILIVQNACAHGERQNNWRNFFRFKSFRVVPVTQEQPAS